MRIAVMAFMAIALCVTSYAKADTFVEPTFGTTDWLGFMNVYETPANGGDFVFGDGWGIDYIGNPTLPNEIGGFGPDFIEMRSASIDDPDPFWFESGAPGSGAVGNKLMEANLYKEFGEGSTGSLGGMDLIFNFQITDFSFDSDVTAFAFIKEFTPGYASVFSETYLPITSTGSFSFAQAIDGSQGAVQYGFVTNNIVVWSPDDVYVNGSMRIGIPEPTSAAILGLAVVGMVARRRR